MTNLLDRTGRTARSARTSGTDRTLGGRDEGVGTPRLPSGPRTRRPLVAAASVAVVFLSVALFASLYSSAHHQVDALMVIHTVEQGQTITGSDLGPVSVAISGGVHPIAVADASTLAGQRAAVTVPAGSLLVPGDVTPASPLPSDAAVVGLALKEGQLPSMGVNPGDRVMIVQTAVPGTSVSAAPESPSTGVSGPATGVLVPEATVFDTADSAATASSGVAELVSVEVPRSVAASVAAEATSGQVSLVLLPPGSSGASEGGGS